MNQRIIKMMRNDKRVYKPNERNAIYAQKYT